MERQVVRCEKCDELICVLKEIFPTGTVINASMVEPNMGQGPWFTNDKFDCRVCGAPWDFSYYFVSIEELGVHSR